ncbi:hypothetical protein BJV82DRAFT_709089 [Fennellomyces sp. T-0311]|nr:hypothetical protein BJV82DRAFT_709089 [Fennellomyces sp. T-0311]
MNSTQSTALNGSSSPPGDSAEEVTDDASSHQSATDRPSPHSVRLLVLSGAWHRISRANRVLVVTNLTITIAQLVSIITVLVISRNQYCDRPLDVFLIVYLVRSVVNSPLVLYHNLRPTNQQQQSSPPAASSSSSSESVSSPPSPTTAPDSSNATQTTTNTARTPRREWTDRVKSLLDIFGVVWFIIGNYFLFTSGQCVREAPSLFYTALVWILLGYLLVLVPLFLCISVIFCLPCVLVLMRTLRLGYATGLVMGATKEEIENVPVYKYKSENAEQPSTSSSPTSSAAPAVPERKKRSSIFRWFFLRRPKVPADIERNYDPITITPAEDAVCSICLSDYEQDDLVCKLWCGHHFHKDCVHEWLALNSSCPLCKRDFRSKNDSS